MTEKFVPHPARQGNVADDADAAATPAFRVRPVALEDRAAWEPLWEGYNRFYGRQLPAEITNVTWARFFDPGEPVHALVAEGGERLLGLAHYLFHRSTIQIGPTCYLQDLYTDESARGKGIGRALIESVSRKAREGGAARLYWQTHETNAQAMRLYDAVAERSGFVVYRLPL